MYMYIDTTETKRIIVVSHQKKKTIGITETSWKMKKGQDRIIYSVKYPSKIKRK